MAISRRYSTTRMEAFSDGVFAIAITLLILDIGISEGAEGHLGSALFDEWPVYLAYVISFSTIGALWLGHSGMTEYLEGADPILLRYTLLLLLVVSFLPFPTGLLSEYISAEGAERIAVTIYGLNLLFAAGMLSLTWRHALRAGLVREDLDEGELDELTRRLTPGVAGYVVAIVIGLFAPIAAVVLYAAIGFFMIVPTRRHIRVIAKPRG